MKLLHSALSLLLLASACTLLTRGRCGDEIIDLNQGETCDDGANQDGDGCDKDCKLEALCGDGLLTSPETCDDTNLISGDGCRDDCNKVESGFVCPTPGASCEDICLIDADCEDQDQCTTDTCNTQNGQCILVPLDINDGDDCTLDQCDPNTGVTHDPQDEGFVCDDGNNANVRDICLAGICQPSICGDLFIDAVINEECDDANDEEKDGCTTLCKVGTPCFDNEFGAFGDNATTDPNTGDCYIRVNPPGFDFNWFGAEFDCNQHNNGHLASIENEEIQDLVQGVAEGVVVWVGLNDQAQEDTFVWVDEDPSIFRNFAKNEPSDSGLGGEDCVVVLASGQWNDEDCGVSLRQYICEFE